VIRRLGLQVIDDQCVTLESSQETLGRDPFELEDSSNGSRNQRNFISNLPPSVLRALQNGSTLFENRPGILVIVQMIGNMVVGKVSSGE